MKKLFTLLTILMQFLSHAEDTLQSPASIKKFSIGFDFSPEIADRVLINSNGDSINKSIINQYNKIDKMKFGYTAGINFGWNITKNLGVEAGIQYSNKGYETKVMDLIFGDKIDRGRGFTYSATPAYTKAQLVYTYNYIDVPLKVNLDLFRLVLGRRQIYFIASAGIAFNIFISQVVKSYLEDDQGNRSQSTSVVTSGLNKINLSPFVGAGINCRASRRMSIRVVPIFRYGLLATTDTPIRMHLWNAGLIVGCYYSF